MVAAANVVVANVVDAVVVVAVGSEDLLAPNVALKPSTSKTRARSLRSKDEHVF